MEHIKETSLVLIILLIALFGVFSLQKKTSLPESEKTYTVILTEKGFSPETINIRKGESVKFETKRGKLFWPASDLHPTHDIYPGFDPRQPIEHTSSWTFKFEKSGEWSYHDHLAPFYTGTIKVR